MSYVKYIECWKDTKKYCITNKINAPKSTKYTYETIDIPKNIYKTEIVILNMDTIKVGLDLTVNNLRPLILNLADNIFPGGHVEMGSGAQEESIFRRTNYFTTLNHQTGFYPINNTEAIYSPSVTVIKDTNLNNFNVVKLLSFIACPGIRNPDLIDNKLSTIDTEILYKKIELIFQVAFKNGHDSLVLGALGCGAWNNPVEQVAEIFQVITKKWEGVFKKIIFAVLEIDKKDYIVKNDSINRSNYEKFKDVFNH